MRRIVTGAVLATLAAAAFLFYSQTLSAADTDFLIYFENSTLALKSQSVDRTVYLPLQEIVRHLGLASTDATGSLTYTIQGQNSRLVLTPGRISYNDQPILLQNPIRREGNQWLVPLDFLSQGLSRVAGLEFRYRPGSRRVFAGRVMTTELAMNAQSLGALTRLTLRAGAPIDVELQKETAQRRAVILLKAKAIDPARERLEYKDALVQSIVFDDSDGMPRLTIAIADDVRDVRLTPSDGNRVYFVDFVREIVTEAGPPTPAASAPAAAPSRPNPNVVTGGSVRVIVIDAGHGGIEPGAANASTLEKDLTLAFARRLRSALQSRLSATVILTRDSDVALTSEERVAVANNNQAGLFISLHAGFAPDKMAAGSSIYIMKTDFTVGISEPAGGRLFLPWFMAYRLNAPASKTIAEFVQSQLTQALPGWKFPIRHGPMGILASATMPALAVEVGNLNNDVSAKTLTDPDFQTKFTASLAAGIEQFAAGGRK